jgi:predicted Zn-dependent peptidase
MSILNRKKSPPFFAVKDIPLPQPKLIHLDNGIPVYIINMGKIDAVKIEVVFKAGRPHEHKATVARATAALLKEGTLNKSSAEIAEHFDFYGGSLNTPFSLDTSSVIMHSLTKHVHHLLPVFAEIIKTPCFLQKELTTFVENSLQELQVELSKNDVLAYRKLTESIFGKDHPYGYNSNETSYKDITINDLKQFHNNFYNAKNAVIIVSGIVSDATIKLLNQYLGDLPVGQLATPYISNTSPQKPKSLFIEKPESIQSAITVGRQLFNRNHEDHTGMFILNTILGGYFGSRLMENIREEKGYTYNIYSSLEPAVSDGYFYISTEVSNEFKEATLAEIYKEIELLQQELVGKSELKMVQNYLLGNMLNLIDGPFNIAEVYKTYIIENTDIQEFNQMIEKVRTIKATELRDLAQKYLQKDDLWEVVVGVK